MAHNPQFRPDEPAGPARVFVLAEDALAAEGLRAALAAESRLQCVERIEDAEVVVWDLGSAAAAGAAGSSALLCGLRARGQAIVSLVADEASAALALQQGASGVLQRRIHAPTLTAAILAVRVGLCVLDAALAEQHLQLPAAPATRDDDLDALTAREREVLELLALGLANKAIADRLGVSVHTVKFHVNSILAKLGADSRTAAVASALRRGLVSS